MSQKKQKLELTWIGKDQRPRLEPRILIEDPEKSYHAKERVAEKDIFDNKLIFGDNLLALKALEQEYTGKVKCIYIDPPYNTGNAFEHYDDGLEHSIWLGLMRDRLGLLRNLLSDDGVIFVQIDDNEQAYLKVLMDEIFGRKNFICNFIWQKKTGASDAKNIAVITEYTLCYAKQSVAGLFSFNTSSFDYKRYRLKDSFELKRGPYYIDNLDRGGLQYSDSLNFGITCPDGSITFPNGRKEFFNDGWIWKWSEKKVKWALENNFLEFRKSSSKKSGWAVCYKNYLLVNNNNEAVERSSPYKNLILNILYNDANKETKALFGENKFDFPKPEQLIQHFISITTKPGDLVLDSFAGSGTTGAVAHKMGRRWIMIELEETCHTHIIPRLQKVLDGSDQGGISKAQNWQGGGGFRYYRLAPSMLEKDKWGQWIICKQYNAAMLSEAMCKHMGFTYAPDESHYWMQGYSTESDFIFVTTGSLTHEYLRAISEEVGPHRTLLICCKAFNANAEDFDNLTLKKIPQVVLAKCEWGKDDYSLNVANLPQAQKKPEQKKLFEG